MSAKDKGDALELALLEEVERALEAGELRLPRDSCRVYHQKAYFSHQRQKEVILDVTVELWLPGAEDFSMLWVFECKNRDRRVQFADVDTLIGALRGIAQHKTKAILVSSTGFTKDVIAAARRDGVSLVLFTPEEGLDWVLHRSNSCFHTRYDELLPGRLLPSVPRPSLVRLSKALTRHSSVPTSKFRPGLPPKPGPVAPSRHANHLHAR